MTEKENRNSSRLVKVILAAGGVIIFAGIIIFALALLIIKQGCSLLQYLS